MACADIPMDIQEPEEESVAEDRRVPLMKYYQVSELMPNVKGPLHDLLQKQPAVLGVRMLLKVFTMAQNSTYNIHFF